MVVHKGEGNQYIISADTGTYKSKTEVVRLNGNVKLLGSTNELKKRLQTKSNQE